jgi:hypothetical protein
MFNVYKNQLSRQTVSSNLTGPKMLPTIRHTYSDIWSHASYRYPISWEAFLDPSDSCFRFVDFYSHLTYICICTFFVAFFEATIDDRNLIFGHKRNLMGPKTLPTIWDTYMKRVTKYQISAINSCCEKCDEKCA